jgi:Flp pilus assembly protein protease CpaA
LNPASYAQYYVVLVLLAVFVFIEWMGREGQYALASVGLRWPRPLRMMFYYIILFAIFWFGGEEQQFIYFQF